ncbi:MAG: DUF3795 domain-containing protein [Candidatus Thorarchaeota archaeon]|nr:DUF3795 domain-containing protein [Candidatus Thorarchaeota archaeon]
MTEDTSEIAYCGIYCAECPSKTGVIADLARDLRKALRDYRYDRIAESVKSIPFFESFKHYSEAYEFLGGLVKMRCKNGCKGGGGPPFCKMRKCCIEKEISGCWECEDSQTCDKLDFLKPSHGDAHRKNLRTLRRSGVSAFLEGPRHWYVKSKDE